MNKRHAVSVILRFVAAGLLAAMALDPVTHGLMRLWPERDVINTVAPGVLFGAAVATATLIVWELQLVKLVARPLRLVLGIVIVAASYPIGFWLIMLVFIGAIPFMPDYLPDDPNTAPPPTLSQRLVGMSAMPIGFFLAGLVTVWLLACAVSLATQRSPKRVGVFAVCLGLAAAVVSWLLVRLALPFSLVAQPVLAALVGYWLHQTALLDKRAPITDG